MHLGIDVPESLKDEIKKIAQIEKRTVSNLVRIILEKYIESRRKRCQTKKRGLKEETN
jgi:metal-responsive CopG/Arc/MetJ family transcriptional regulator